MLLVKENTITNRQIWIRQRLVPAGFFASFGRRTRNQQSGERDEEMKMKALAGIVVTLFLLVFAFAPSRMMGMPPPPPNYSPVLISPTAGQVLYPGQTVRVEWKNSIPTQVTYPAHRSNHRLSLARRGDCNRPPRGRATRPQGIT